MPDDILTGDTLQAHEALHAKPLPPDPEGKNDERADWAETALEAFAAATNMKMRVDKPEIVGDLLADLMHWCDRNNLDFDARLAVARMNYDEETLE